MDKDKEFLKKIEEIMEAFRKTDEEVLNNPNIPQELKDKLIKLRAEEDRNKKIKECLVRLPNESFFEKLTIDLSKFSPEKEFNDEIFGWYENLYISIKK